ncbi:MAG TPA: GNAT family N-acyltransferase [Pseudacidobacterium sp.]|nr:GNAT family N-acyltransferase [Pseudacidobacterium sp.]
MARLLHHDGVATQLRPARPALVPGHFPQLPSVFSPRIFAAAGKYQMRLAISEQEREAACRLRFRVFNLELGEGLRSSYSTGLDMDQFDYVCDHLLVEDRASNEIVGTYRMQSGNSAKQRLGYYSAQEFDFSPYEAIRSQILELGRASIAKEHRSSEVLTLLWRGIAQYCKLHRLRYLIGCSSLNSQDPGEGWAVYEQLRPFLAAPESLTVPNPSYRLPEKISTGDLAPRIPRLLKTYIGIGARICGEPAWDREFGTIDFLTLLDLQQLTPAARDRFLLDGEHQATTAAASCAS